MEIGYYELTYDDIEKVSQMEREFFSTPWSEASIAHYMEAGNTIFVVARHGEETIGYAAVMCVLDEGNLVSIGVHDDYRQMGIASELLDIVYDMAHDRGVTSINLEVRTSNEAAIALYEKHGFVQNGRRKDFYRDPKEDALLFIKEL
ncbi:MAG: ribosomal protein S18-alanine N-acetyltransferase [Lachnospiraceae bacterium]|nr:ribosomal protein S18-alanine N-acetyltransferase [Parasporobacterium sp.]MBR3308799.1 ribosomal protein S18-alanine N-acetyltransferase [Lachnospiraceae bacterium]MDO4529491.1 ribosomal protein S18-alanine N-acetyltransferase [Lachnospiraceae bacterium]MDO4734277.1 ribosomal protein S18-alanine N-acetyltransferase [Lachnospiraceae bacterium]